MSVQDARGRAPFGVVYRDDLSHPVVQALSGRAFRLYVALATYARSGRGRVHPSRATLAELLGVSPRTVQRALAELVAAGVVERVLETDERGVPRSDVVLTSRRSWGVVTTGVTGGGDNRCHGGGDTYGTGLPDDEGSPDNLDAQQTTRTDHREQIPPKPPKGGITQALSVELGLTRFAVEHVEGVLVELLQDRREHGWSADDLDLEDPGRGLVEVLVNQVRTSPFVPNSVAALHRRRIRRLVVALLPSAYAKTTESDAEDARAAAEDQEETRWLVGEPPPPNLVGRWHEVVERALRIDLVAGNLLRLSKPDVVDGRLGLIMARALFEVAADAKLDVVLVVVFREMRLATAS